MYADTSQNADAQDEHTGLYCDSKLACKPATSADDAVAAAAAAAVGWSARPRGGDGCCVLVAAACCSTRCRNSAAGS